MKWIIIGILCFVLAVLVCSGTCSRAIKNNGLAYKLGCNMDYQSLGGKYDDHLMVWSGNTDPDILHRAIDAWATNKHPNAVRDSILATNAR